MLLLSKEQRIAFDQSKRPNVTDEDELSCFELGIDSTKARDALIVSNYYMCGAKANSLFVRDKELYAVIDPIIKNEIKMK
jgi:hypothetical protein